MKKIVCLGDSLTYGFGVRRGLVWTCLAASGGTVELINKGINGDTTGGMLARFSDDVEAQRPAAVLLMGGANDIILGAGGAVARANIAAMAHRAVARCILPIIGIPIAFSLPVREDWAALADFTVASVEYNAYADWLRRFCAAFRFPMADFRAVLLAASEVEGPQALYLDGLHPSARGHEILAAALKQMLESGLARA